MKIAFAFAFACAVVSGTLIVRAAIQPAEYRPATPSAHTAVSAKWKRAYNHGRVISERFAAGRIAAAPARCTEIVPLQAYRFIDGIDDCMRPMTPAEVTELGDPFAVNVLAKGLGKLQAWPTTVEALAGVISAVPGFASNQRSYMLGEGSQITTEVAARDLSRDLRYVITWGANASPTIFVSAAPSGTHPGRPPDFLQVIGYDQARNVFNYYEYVGTPGGTVRSWAYAGSSENARLPQTAGRGCMACHINGALNMKELVVPWNNWNSSAANISLNNIPTAVTKDPLFTQVSAADQLQLNFQSLQNLYSRGLVSSVVKSGTVTDVATLLRRIITTTTVNFTSSPSASADPIQLPQDFFLALSSLTTTQVGLSFAVPASYSVTKSRYATFITEHEFALQQLNQSGNVVYQKPGGNISPLFVPVRAYEDVAMMQQLINQKVIDANFAAAVLLVDFPNPVFSATRDSLMQYANKIGSAKILGPGANPDGVPSQFIALVKAAAAKQQPCAGALLQCSAEQQFLFYAGQSDWKARAQQQVNPYLASVATRLATDAGANDYLMLWASRQAQFAGAPVISNLDEFSLLLPCNNLAIRICKRMNADGSIAPDPLSSCVAQTCALPGSPSITLRGDSK